MRKFILIALVLLAGVIALLLVFAPGRSSLKPKVTVTLLGYTNDAAGGYFARFVVTNADSGSVIRHVGYHLQTQSTNARGWTNVLDGWFKDQGNLRSGASEIVLVPVSTNRPTWRLSLRVLRDVPFPTLMIRWAYVRVRSIVTPRPGQSGDYHNPQYAVNSDWVDQ